MTACCPVVSATTLAEALAALRGASADTRVLAGGTDLMVELQIGRRRPDRVVDVWRVGELRGIEPEADGLRLGALTTCRELLRSPLVRERADLLVLAAREVGAEQIQSRATLGGNLGTASPAADLNPVLLALDAEVRLVSAAGRRALPAREFLTGYRATARRPDELVEAVWIPPRPPSERRAFRKVGTRAAQSIAKVVVALALELEEGVVRRVTAAAGSVAERTVLLPSLAAELEGHAPSPALLAAAARRAALADAHPIDDVRSTAAYRREVLARLLRTMLTTVC